jgi:hypothetical protein
MRYGARFNLDVFGNVRVLNLGMAWAGVQNRSNATAAGVLFKISPRSAYR